jgi:hypothetical protein
LHHAFDGVFDVAQQQAFGEFEFEAPGVGAGFAQGLQDFGGKAAVPELPRADVDGDAQVGGFLLAAPAYELFARGVQDVPAQGRMRPVCSARG